MPSLPAAADLPDQCTAHTTEEELDASVLYREDILSLAHSPPGVIASGDYSGSIMLWSLHGGDRKLLLTHAGAPPDRAAVEALAFLPLPGVKTAKVLLSCGGETFWQCCMLKTILPFP